MKNISFIGISFLCFMIAMATGCKAPASSDGGHQPTKATEKAKSAKIAKAPMMKAIKRTDKKGKDEKAKPKSLPVEVPDEVKTAFKEVTLRLAKKDGSFQKDFTVKIGEKTPLGDSGISVEVLAYLPAFYMDQKRITSVGTKATNPACKAGVFENGAEIHTGWLFQKMPEVHAFEHAQYSLILVGGES